MDERQLNQWMAERGYELRSDGWHKVSRVLQAPKPEPGVGHEPVAENEGEDYRPGFRFVRIKSFRTRLIDERNLYDKAVVDALRYAGIIRDDTPQWCAIQVTQVQVGIKADERTEIEITDS